MSTTLTHPGLPVDVTRFDLLRLFEQVARPGFGLSSTAVALVRQYVLKTMDADYARGRICAVWTQACRFAEMLGITPRSINSAERELERAGFIIRNAGINGGRAGDRQNGIIVWAAGINLAPLIQRYGELRAKAEALDLQARAISQCRAEIRQLGQRIREAEDDSLRERAEVILPHGRTARITSITRLAVKLAVKSLGVLIRKAEWLGNGRAPTITSAHDELAAALAAGTRPDLCPEPSPLPFSAASPEIAASAAPEPEPLPEPSIATPLPDMPAPDAAEVKNDAELVLTLGDRRYRVRGWKKPQGPESLKVNLLVHRPADVAGRFHVDTLDLYAAKARAAFVKAAGIELGEAEDVLKHDLGRVLLALEAAQEAEISAALIREDKPVMSAEDRAEAMALLKAPDVMDRILADFAHVGVVGEAVNIQTGYLACVSRLLDRPLAIIIQSSSAPGKSAMMDAVLAMMPADAQVRYSAMTGQSLFYMGETTSGLSRCPTRACFSFVVTFSDSFTEIGVPTWITLSACAGPEIALRLSEWDSWVVFRFGTKPPAGWASIHQICGEKCFEYPWHSQIRRLSIIPCWVPEGRRSGKCGVGYYEAFSMGVIDNCEFIRGSRSRTDGI